MFVMTMNKTTLRRLGAAAVCVAALAAGVLGLKSMSGEAVETAASPGLSQKITGAQDLQTFLAGYGVEVDPATAEVSQVKVPRKWDDSFKAFHDVIKQSGLDLSKCKNKTVDKWVVSVPAQSNETTQTFAVVLVYKEEAKAAYFLQRPSGEVLPMTPPQAQASAQATQPVEETAAQPDPVQQAAAQAVDPAAQAQETAVDQPVTSEPVNAENPVEMTQETAVQAGAVPTE